MTTREKRSASRRRSESITIRQFRTTDLAKVMQIERRAFPDAWDENWFMYFYEVNPSGFVVAVAGRERVVGYALVDIEGEGQEAWLTVEPGKLTPVRAHLLNLAVDDEWREKGIGGWLLDAAKRYALERGVKEIWLEVQVNNTNAITFYSKRGFKNTGQILRNYYPDGGDALVMRKKLSK